jgi:rhodanese-related sulfurtransferase
MLEVWQGRLAGSREAQKATWEWLVGASGTLQVMLGAGAQHEPVETVPAAAAQPLRPRSRKYTFWCPESDRVMAACKESTPARFFRCFLDPVLTCTKREKLKDGL